LSQTGETSFIFEEKYAYFDILYSVYISRRIVFFIRVKKYMYFSVFYYRFDRAEQLCFTRTTFSSLPTFSSTQFNTGMNGRLRAGNIPPP